MHYHVMAATYVSEYVIRLTFRDGTVGDVDLEHELRGPVFEPLKDIEQFKKFHIDPEFHTIIWANGADLAPEFLYQAARVTAGP
ncbi:MAG: DUF2442 domain-containing protein [Chloroflexi bacterium]|nr:DUF2442 domain-containing protein [Chloroflexota bacterium]